MFIHDSIHNNIIIHLNTLEGIIYCSIQENPYTLVRALTFIEGKKKHHDIYRTFGVGPMTPAANASIPYAKLLALLKLWEQESTQQGIVTGSANSPASSFSYRSHDYFIPASCLKLITGLIAIKELRHDFQYVTTLQKEPAFSGEETNYRLIFTGDPKLKSQHIAQLLLPLKGKGIKGHLIIDHSAFQTPPWSPHWMQEDIGSDYASPLLAAIIDRNAYECVIYLEEKDRPAFIKGLETIRHRYTATKASIPKSTLKSMWHADEVIVEACLADHDDQMNFTISHPNGIVFLTQKLQKILSDLDIIFEKGLEFQQEQPCPENQYFEVINKHCSPSLKQFLPPAMKISDNLIFDALYLTLLNCHNFTQWSEGSDMMRKLVLKHLGLDFQHNRIVDGSGLSRDNQIQPHLLWSVLKEGLNEPLFINSLPSVMEKETSLEHRSELPKNLKAKTGSMTGINGLCGYKGNPNNPEIFVIIQTNPSFKSDDFYPMQKLICQEILS